MRVILVEKIRNLAGKGIERGASKHVAQGTKKKEEWDNKGKGTDFSVVTMIYIKLYSKIWLALIILLTTKMYTTWDHERQIYPSKIILVNSATVNNQQNPLFFQYNL